MGAKLCKKEHFYVLKVGGEIVGTDNKDLADMYGNVTLLSKYNCDMIFGVVSTDVDKLAVDYCQKAKNIDMPYANGLYYGFLAGFKANDELNKEKLFTLDDMRKMYDMSCGNIGLGGCADQTENDERFNEQLDLIETEIEVEVEMEIINDGLDESAQPSFGRKQKLDADGCLILIKK
jgi:hypothetical protein